MKFPLHRTIIQLIVELFWANMELVFTIAAYFLAIPLCLVGWVVGVFQCLWMIVMTKNKPMLKSLGLGKELYAIHMVRSLRSLRLDNEEALKKSCVSRKKEGTGAKK